MRAARPLLCSIPEVAAKNPAGSIGDPRVQASVLWLRLSPRVLTRPARYGVKIRWSAS